MSGESKNTDKKQEAADRAAKDAHEAAQAWAPLGHLIVDGGEWVGREIGDGLKGVAHAGHIAADAVLLPVRPIAGAVTLPITGAVMAAGGAVVGAAKEGYHGVVNNAVDSSKALAQSWNNTGPNAKHGTEHVADVSAKTVEVVTNTVIGGAVGVVEGVVEGAVGGAYKTAKWATVDQAVHAWQNLASTWNNVDSNEKVTPAATPPKPAAPVQAQNKSTKHVME